MSSSINLNLERIKRQLENSTNVNILQTPKRVVRKQIKKPVNKVVKKPVNKVVKKPVVNSETRSTRIVNPKLSEDNTYWNILYTLILVTTLFFIGMLLYNLYLYYLDKKQEVPVVIVEDNIKKDPKGVIIDQEGAPITVEKGGDITENKYLSLYGSNNFIDGNRGSQCEYGQYASYPGGVSRGIDIDFNGYSRYNEYGPGYGSQSDDGVTKIYYKNVMNSERSKINKYIRNQNDYIKNINRRVRQINSSRMNTPTYSRDMAVLQEIRNYERRLANQVNREEKNQPYLQDQNKYY